MIHELKILPEYFEAVFTGSKTFEIRQNDRGFKVGDFVELYEYEVNKGFTGRILTRQITYIFEGGQYGLSHDFVCFALGVGRGEQCIGCKESTGETKLWCCNHCGKRIEDF